MAKAMPIRLIKNNNKVSRETKAQIEARGRAEPTIKSNALVCPVRLSADAASVWERVTALYKEFENPIINDLDADVLAIYCEAVAMHAKAMKAIADSAIVYKSTKDGDYKTNPWVKIANDSAKTMKDFGEVLLLNPISRAKAGLERVNTDVDALSPMARFLKERLGDA